ncbi:Bud2p [Sugiyamaella lignohabitans]|uniref:Bud2p n=1 Tax=Sugiyamaella lignohabitans TaxID=796027 RepID=A0A161HG51_9ASCO|nr:Bud2p [Sugiyamaella lignohabitans]ANB11671.1 Bud2p [Sugiyamaella lignohabitans]
MSSKTSSSTLKSQSTNPATTPGPAPPPSTLAGGAPGASRSPSPVPIPTKSRHAKSTHKTIVSSSVTSSSLSVSDTNTPPKPKRSETSKRRLLKASLSAQSFKAAFGSPTSISSISSSSSSSVGGSGASIGRSVSNASGSANGNGTTISHGMSGGVSPVDIVDSTGISGPRSTSPLPVPVPINKLASNGLRPLHSGASSTYSSQPSPTGSVFNNLPTGIVPQTTGSSVNKIATSSSVALPQRLPEITDDEKAKVVAATNGSTITPASPPLPFPFSVSRNISTSSLHSPGIEAGIAVSRNVSQNSSTASTGTSTPAICNPISSDVLVSSISAFGISNMAATGSPPFASAMNSPPPAPNPMGGNLDDYVVGTLDEDSEQDHENEDGSKSSNHSIRTNDSTTKTDSSLYNGSGQPGSRSVSGGISHAPPYVQTVREKKSLDSLSSSLDFAKRADSLRSMWESLEPNLRTSMRNYKSLQSECPVQWISSDCSEWVLGTGVIGSDGSLTLKLDDKEAIVISDLRRTTVVGTPHKRYMELVVPPSVSTTSRIILSPTSESDFNLWLSSLLLFSSLKPRGMQEKVWIVPRDDLPPRSLGGKEAQIIGHFEVYFPYYRSKNSRKNSAAFSPKPTKPVDKVSVFSKEGMWQPVVGSLDKSGVFRLTHVADGSLVQVIDMTKIFASRVREIDSSVFECRRVVYVYCQDAIMETQFEHPNKSRESHLFFCRFENSSDYYDWFTALRAFALHRIFSLSTPCTISASPVSKEISPILASSASSVSVASNLSSSVGGDLVPNLRKVMRVCRQINLRIIEGKIKDSDKSGVDINPFRDTYIEVQFENVVWARTFVCQGNSAPFWREDFVLNDFPVIGPTIKLVLKRRLSAAVSPIMDVAIGSIVLDEQKMRECEDVEKWLPLVYTPEAEREYDFDLYLCLKIGYDETKVLAAEKYAKLDSLLSDVSNSLTVQISEATGDINRLSDIFLKIMLSNCQALQWLVSLIDYDIEKVHETIKAHEKDPDNFPDIRKNFGNTLFRGNSLLTKSLERYMKLCGSDYLDKIVGVFARKVVHNAVYLEIDPDRLAQQGLSPEEVETTVADNQQKLCQYTTYLWNLIKNSVDDMPCVFKLIFKRLREQLSRELKRDEGHVVYNSVAGFLFLRFFCPAILNPKLFGLTRTHPTGNVQRSLTLITKMLQGFANRVRFGLKEPWMIPMNKFLDTHETELLEFYKAVTLCEGECDVTNGHIEEHCRRKKVNDGSLQNAIGCTLSNPYLIDKFENFAKMIEIWNKSSSAKKLGPKLEPKVDTLETPKSDAKADLENNDNDVKKDDVDDALRKFASYCREITDDRDELSRLLEEPESISVSNEEDILNSIDMKFDTSNGKVTLSKTRIAASKAPNHKKVRLKSTSESIQIIDDSVVESVDVSPKKGSRWMRLASRLK